jgi:hypothetical protein
MARLCRIWRFICHAALWLATFHPACISATEYEVQGEIFQSAFKPDGNIQHREFSQFSVFVRDCSWLIQMTECDESGKPLSKREVASAYSDGCRTPIPIHIGQSFQFKADTCSD